MRMSPATTEVMDFSHSQPARSMNFKQLGHRALDAPKLFRILLKSPNEIFRRSVDYINK